ncbi:MAG: tetratricopeptide repeat protein [Gemmatimonadetes bacterium]|nr:tetratricopeptide repeat protein [Gemmatimonadota bacterium]
MADEVEPAAAAEVTSEAAAPEPAESPVDVPSAGSDVGEMEPPEAVAAEAAPETVPDEPGAEAVPEASPAEAVPAAVAESEPEPVVTETMADVYVSQGLYAEARAVYEQLLERRPDDTGLQAKLADLEGAGVRVGGEPSLERPESTPVQVFAASETGGLSARAFVTRVLAATVGTPSHQASPGEGDASSSAASPSDAAPTPPEEPSPLEAAFEAPEPADLDAPGEPTQPAADSPSLAAVFDETPDVSGGQSPTSPPSPQSPQSPQSPPPPDAEQPDGEPAAKDGEMSFDEFFGDGQAQAPAGETPEPAADPADDVREDRDFKDWLKGLKS